MQTTDEDVREARDEIAIPALAAPITVDVEGDDLVVEPLDIAKSLSLEAVDGKITPVIREQALHERVEGKLRMVGTPAVDASFDVSSGTPVVVPSKTPVTTSRSAVAEFSARCNRRTSSPAAPYFINVVCPWELSDAQILGPATRPAFMPWSTR